MSLKTRHLKTRHWWQWFWDSGQAPSLHDIDINITFDSINPISMEIYLPSTRLKGDQEAWLGGISDSGPEGDGKQDNGADEGVDGDQPSQELDDDRDFRLYS
ncbi:hypothetical protein SAMD00023353_3300040 [Rosellinia necatrix]|uniref:Uncharacterized protein n=1 Tax=Rosellinia necatrix TaxID=77044 RepID=A0A1S8A8T1_ROSNE|nr:hypothetical protein SAMD00023353_3300040 [Rosellinia necatrix]